MAKLIFGMMQSIDGYVDDKEGTLTMPAPGPALFQHFVDHVSQLAGCLYGRRIYEVMRYWDNDEPSWTDAERAFAAAWRSQPKFVVSRTLKSLGPNATLISNDVQAAVRRLKSDLDGE